MLDFELLRSFVAVADCGGFHRAAERLNLTQSTISQQIKRLELETKRPLFRRTTRSVALTDDGEMLLGDADRLPQLEEAARHRLAAPWNRSFAEKRKPSRGKIWTVSCRISQRLPLAQQRSPADEGIARRERECTPCVVGGRRTRLLPQMAWRE